MAIPNAEIWQSMFDEIFEEIEDCPLDSSAHGSFDALRPLIYNSKGTATYKCNKCKRSWQSINALVEFEYRLSRGHSHDFGSVKLVLNGQKCKYDYCLTHRLSIFHSVTFHFDLDGKISESK